MRNTRRKLLSQNFLRNRRLVSKLVGNSSIAKNDLVLEVGPGNGIITQELLAKAQQVIAVELDPYWYDHLQTRFQGEHGLILYKGDFLTHTLPQLPYKVFANIPFAVEGKIIRKLIEAENPPQECYLVVMSELAKRLAAEDTNNMFSAMHKPWFEFSITHRFKPSDFSPVPNVQAVLFRFMRKEKPLLPFSQRRAYQDFVKLGYDNGRSVRSNLKKRFSLSQIDKALHTCWINKKAKPSHLSAKQWVLLFKNMNL